MSSSSPSSTPTDSELHGSSTNCGGVSLNLANLVISGSGNTGNCLALVTNNNNNNNTHSLLINHHPHYSSQQQQHLHYHQQHYHHHHAGQPHPASTLPSTVTSSAVLMMGAPSNCFVQSQSYNYGGFSGGAAESGQTDSSSSQHSSGNEDDLMLLGGGSGSVASPPPPIASRPERTKSIYTRPIEDPLSPISVASLAALSLTTATPTTTASQYNYSNLGKPSHPFKIASNTTATTSLITLDKNKNNTSEFMKNDSIQLFHFTPYIYIKIKITTKL